MAQEDTLALKRANPDLTVRYDQTTEGLTETKTTSRRPGEVVSVYAHPLAVIRRTAGDEVLRLQYSGNLDSLDELPTLKTWISGVDLYVKDERKGDGTDKIDFVEMSKLSIGACIYDVWKVHETLTLTGQQAVIMMKYYSPDLKVVLRATALSPDGQVVGDTRYDQIEVLKN
jgi:hypothetical protein